jgi:hypothetical protein
MISRSIPLSQSSRRQAAPFIRVGRSRGETGRKFYLAMFAAFALLGSISASFAQPAPVPALPDAERRTSYSISASTCACSIGFALFGDSNDYWNWLEVFVNGALIPASGNWTITSPSGSLSSLPRPITDAVLTFTAAQTGTVQIVGARRPRRVSQFSENTGVPARNINQAFTDITATLREMWDKTNDMTGRGLFSQPGVTLGLLPTPSACAGKFLSFDITGLNPQCLPGAGSGNVVGPASSTAGHFAIFTNTIGTLLADHTIQGSDLPTPGASSIGGVFSKDCSIGAQFVQKINADGTETCNTPSAGSVICGGVDDSAALQAAINAMPSNGGYIYLPVNGNNCVFATTLDFRGKSYIRVVGGGSMGTAPQSSALIYSGTGARAIDMRDTAGDSFEGIGFGWSNASFAGLMVDYGSQTPGTNVSFYGRISRSQFTPAGGSGTAVTCVNVSEAIEFYIGHNSFNSCGIAIHGQNVLGQSTTGLIEHNQFYHTGVLPIIECGESWTLFHNTFEQLASGKAAAFQNSLTLPCKSMVWIDNWFGDVTTSGGSWFNQLQAQGFTAIGDKMSANNSGGNLGYNIVGGSGYSWVNGNYDSMSIPFQCDGTNKPTGMNWTGNTLTNITGASNPVVAPTANCLNASEASNTPAMFGPNWTPTFTPGGGAAPATVNNAKYKRNGLTTEYWFTATFGTVTGTGSLTVGGLPFPAAQPCEFAGHDGNSSQTTTGTVSAGGTAFIVFLASNPATYPVATGSVLTMHGSCETN